MLRTSEKVNRSLNRPCWIALSLNQWQDVPKDKAFENAVAPLQEVTGKLQGGNCVVTDLWIFGLG